MFKKFALCSILVTGFCISAFAQKVVLVTGEFPPYSGEKLPGKGFISELVMAAAKAANIEVDLSFVPWARCEAMIKDGTAFASFPYAITDERKKTVDFSSGIYDAPEKIFYYEGNGKNIDWTSLKDFQNSKFGGVRSYFYMDALNKNGIKVDVTNSTESAIAMLQAGRFEYLIENELVARSYINAKYANDAAKFKTLAKTYYQNTSHLMVSRSYPGSKELLQKFNAGLATIRQDGTYNKILTKYGLQVQ